MNEKLMLLLKKLVLWIDMIEFDVSISGGLVIGGYSAFYVTGERGFFYFGLGAAAGFLLFRLGQRLYQTIRRRRRRIKSTLENKLER